MGTAELAHPAVGQLVQPTLTTAVTILTQLASNPSWLLPLLRSRFTGALLALLYLHPERDCSLTEAGKAIGARIMRAPFEITIDTSTVPEFRPAAGAAGH